MRKRLEMPSIIPCPFTYRNVSLLLGIKLAIFRYQRQQPKRRWHYLSIRSYRKNNWRLLRKRLCLPACSNDSRGDRQDGFHDRQCIQDILIRFIVLNGIPKRFFCEPGKHVPEGRRSLADRKRDIVVPFISVTPLDVEMT